MNYPVRKVYLTQGWGENPDIYSRFGLKGHNGIDLRVFDNNGNRAISGDLIAPHDGKIIEASLDSDGYGWYYKIENDVEGSILGHNKQLLFKVGDTVEEGQLIAYTDNTGWSTGAHVHWGYYRKPRDRGNGYSGTCDPKPFINPKVPSTQEDMTENTALDACLKQHTELVDQCNKKDEEIKQLKADLDKEVQNHKKSVLKYDEKIDSLNETIESNQQKCKEMMADYEQQIDKLTEDASKELLEQLNSSKEKLANCHVEKEQVLLEKSALSNSYKDLLSQLKQHNILVSTDSNGLLIIKKVSKNIFQKLWELFINN